MNDFTNLTCEHGEELVSFLYGELDAREANVFQSHLRSCGKCNAEAESLGLLRNKIALWKQEALTGFRSLNDLSFAPQPQQKQSALAAIKGFFDLSPLWLKGAVGLASALFCLFTIIAIGKLEFNRPSNLVAVTYTQSQVDKIVADALAARRLEPVVTTEVNHSPIVKDTSASVRKAQRRRQPAQFAASRRPLTKTERAQLAYDLRLSNSRSEDGVDLLADRINE